MKDQFGFEMRKHKNRDKPGYNYDPHPISPAFEIRQKEHSEKFWAELEEKRKAIAKKID